MPSTAVLSPNFLVRASARIMGGPFRWAWQDSLRHSAARVAGGSLARPSTCYMAPRRSDSARYGSEPLRFSTYSRLAVTLDSSRAVTVEIDATFQGQSVENTTQ